MESQFYLNILYALAILVGGIIFSKFSTAAIKSIMDRRKVDAALSGFICNLTKSALLLFAVIAALNRLGIETTSLIAVLGATGLAIGLALKDSLGNLAAGFMILIFRQFKAGDVIEVAGVVGTVESLNIFSTQLRTGDNRTVFIPNGKLVAENIVNYSIKGIRRVDLIYGVSYDADFALVRKIINEALDAETRILKEPVSFIGVLELADSSVNFAVRPWVKVTDYWPVLFALNEDIKERFDAAGVNIPFPQRDIHIHKHTSTVKRQSEKN